MPGIGGNQVVGAPEGGMYVLHTFNTNLRGIRHMRTIPAPRRVTAAGTHPQLDVQIKLCLLSLAALPHLHPTNEVRVGNEAHGRLLQRIVHKVDQSLGVVRGRAVAIEALRIIGGALGRLD